MSFGSNRAPGKTMPQMEVRFKNVSISADIVVKDEKSTEVELPTLKNEVMKGIRGLTASKHTVKKQILKGVNGVFKPGTITLVLGQPSSGKSSLMKLLSGRFPDEKNITIEGDVTYNGVPAAGLRKVLPQFVSYVPQRDKHYPMLTVKETMEFAHACSGGDPTSRAANLSTPDESAGTYPDNLEAAHGVHKQYPDTVIKQLGLENCQNTVVGDAMMRGVSGGERKRVTTGEMAFSNNYVMMMDEISTGLDSAATFDIISTQRSIAKMFSKTVVISLLQPSPEVFELFDDVMILNDGRVMYHGPREKTLGYFESLGFWRPLHRDVADFLLDLGTDEQYQYEVDIAPGDTLPRFPSEFAEVFERSSIHNRMLHELDEPVHSNVLQLMNKLVDSQPQFAQSFRASTSLLIKRQITMMRREATALVGRFAMNVIVGFMVSSVYYQFDPADSQLVMGIIFEAALNLSLGQSAQIPTIMAAREVFYKQRGANFFRTASYVLSHSMNQVLPVILESVALSSVVYWMCGFVDTIENFLIFFAVLCLADIAFVAFFFFLASASPNLNVANPISIVFILFFVAFAGFTITKEQIPDYLIWIYWINPIAWTVRALAINQYSEERFNVCVYKGIDYCANYGMTMGKYSLTTYEVPSDKFWLWYGMAFLAVVYVVFMTLSFIALEYRRYESPENVVLSTENKDDSANPYTLAQTPHHSTIGNDMEFAMTPARDNRITPVTVAFKDLWYSVPDPMNSKNMIDLLKGINGYALPGTITALMGSSGAGKTTLMDVIAGRKTGGKIQGQILLNGHPATDLAIRRATGYCEQMDIHWESSTIREALTFSAFLRQPADIPDSEKYDSVNECLDLLDLTPIADNIVRGSSVE